MSFECRMVISPCFVEYGTSAASPAALLVFRFAFHPFDARFCKALFTLSFELDVTVVALGPDWPEGNYSEVNIKNMLNGSLTLGFPGAGVNIGGTVGGGKEKAHVKKSKWYIQGSGIDTDLVLWTMMENEQDKSGLPDKFIGAVVLQTEGEFKGTLKTHATIGGNGAIRKIVSEKEYPIQVDGKTKKGVRPPSIQIEKNYFVLA